MKTLINTLILLAALASAGASAGQAVLSWTAPPAPAPTSGCTYTKIQIDYGSGGSGAYTASAQTVTAADTTLTLTGLDEGKVYYFAAKSLGTCGGVAKTSPYSNEVKGEIPIGSPLNLKLGLSPASTFGAVKVGTTIYRNYPVTNRDSQPVNLLAPTTSGAPFSASPTPKTIPPGGQALFTVFFKPTQPGWAEGRIILRTATSAPIDYPITGYGY